MAQPTQKIVAMKQLTPAVQQAPATQYWNDSVVEVVVVEDDGAEFTRESSIFCGEGHAIPSLPNTPGKIVLCILTLTIEANPGPL